MTAETIPKTMSKKSQVKYKKAPQAPRRFKSSYMFFSTDKHRLIRKELAEKGEKLSTTDVAKLVSQAWKNMPSEEREEWEELAQRDKARYEMEKSMYTGPWKVPAKKRSQKDPNAPKRPMSAFLSFSNSRRSQVKKTHPDIGNAEVSRILAQMWKDASEDERKEHIDKEFKLRQEYKVAIAEWRKTSETEMQAARKEREDEAMRAVLAKGSSQESAGYDQSSGGEQPHNSYYQPQPNSQGSTHNHYPGVGMHGEQAGAGFPHYYPHAGHYNAPNGFQQQQETTSAAPVDPSQYGHGGYYSRGYDGYANQGQTPYPYQAYHHAGDYHGHQTSESPYYPGYHQNQHDPYYGQGYYQQQQQQGGAPGENIGMVSGANTSYSPHEGGSQHP